MPRVIPRLVEKIAQQADRPQFYLPPGLKRSRTKKSLHRPLHPKPSYHPADYEQSILLTPGNPVSEKKAYVRHKTVAPNQFGPIPPREGEVDPPRMMTDSEYRWWSNSYLRMLISPMRKCVVTGRLLPSDFLVRCVAVRVSAARIRHKGDPTVTVPVVVPDGLQHPKFTRRISGGAIYALCWRQVIERIQSRFHHYPRIPGCVVSPRLDQQIAHQLRLRVVQEFILLASKVELLSRQAKKWKPEQGPIPMTMRRLSIEEFIHMRKTGTAPYKDAVAVIILPPVNRDTVTKKRPEPSISSLPPDDEQHPSNLPPVSTLLSATAETEADLDDSLPDILPKLQIPLYNGISCFPSRSQRRAMYDALKRITAAEHLINKKRPASERPPKGKASHAVVLCSNGGTARVADPAAAAMALWRLRIFEGDGWTKSSDLQS